MPLSDIPKLKKYQLTRKTLDGKRHYATPEGCYVPSVTTITSNANSPAGKARLAKWRTNNPNSDATSRGTYAHSRIEHYLSQHYGLDLEDEPVDIVEHWEPFAESIKLWIEQQTDFVPFAMEYPVWCGGVVGNVFKGYAGTFDCLAYLNGKLTLLDWKTAEKRKSPSYCQNYFNQMGAYFKAIEYVYGLKIEQSVIVMGIATTDDEGIRTAQSPRTFLLDKDELEYRLNVFRLQWKLFFNGFRNYYEYENEVSKLR